MKNRYLIGQAAKFLNVSKDTLRYYDKIGIISPKKDNTNRYRYYTMDEVISLTYILTLKELDIPLEEIKSIVHNNKLSDMVKVIERQNEIIDKKMKELEKIKSTINSFRKSFSRAEEDLNKFKILENQPIIYKNISEDIDESIAKVVEEFNAYSDLLNIVYTIIIKQDYFKSNDLGGNYQYAMSCENSNDGELNNIEGTFEYKKRKCLYTVMRVMDDIEESDLEILRRYMCKNNIEVCGDIMARHIAFEHENEKPIDYYEVWIPIK